MKEMIYQRKMCPFWEPNTCAVLYDGVECADFIPEPPKEPLPPPDRLISAGLSYSQARLEYEEELRRINAENARRGYRAY